jgi:Uma2 family endonuclease
MAQAPVETVVTPEEFAQLPDPPHGGKVELVGGRVVVMAPVGPEHGERASDISSEMRDFVRPARLGAIRVETGYWIGGDIRAPDVSFVSRERLAAETILHGAVQQVPDLAIEITSPGDRDREVQEKVEAYLAAGVQRVWVVRPELQTVTVHRPGGDAHTFGLAATLTSDDAGFAQPGFALNLRDLFQPAAS